MWNFNKFQETFEISGVTFGGSPNERPTVMVGSIFYSKHKIVKDMNTGEFDKMEAEKQINQQQELSEKTGLPCALDVIGSTPQSIEKYLDFILKIFDGPIFLDGSTDDVRIKGLLLSKEWGISRRIIYNSITPDYKKEELKSINESGAESCVLLAYTSTSFNSKGRISAIKELLPELKKSGINKTLIDTCVIDIPSLGSASRVIITLKNELGLPVGNGSHNAISTWRGLGNKFKPEVKKPVIAVAAAITASVGGDFCLYGPLHTAPYVFPSVAMVNAAQEQLGIEEGIRINRNLPLFRIG